MRGPSKNDFFAAGLIVIVVLAMFKLGVFESKPIAGGKEYFMPNLYEVNKGIITDKYVDSENHNNETIELLINDTLEAFYILSGPIDKKLFNYIKVNDSLIKTKFGNEIIIKREEKESTFKLDIMQYN